LESLYELAVVLHPDLEIDIEKPLSRIEKVLQKHGRFTSREEWGKRKLAYAINGQQFGLYYFYQLALAPSAIVEIERALTINEEVLRHLIIKVPKTKIDIETVSKENKEKPGAIKELKNSQSNNKDAKVATKEA
jgi:small subunit ribosomal protein S6